MDKAKLLKLAKMVMTFASVKTDKGELTYDGEFAVGVEVFVEDEAGEMVAAQDGEYIAEDKKITVKDGKVEEIEVPEPEDKPAEEEVKPAEEEMKKECMEDAPVEEQEPAPAEPDEKDVRIAELEGLLADRDAIIEELTAKVKELEDKVAQPVEEPVKMNRIEKVASEMKNGALKYFQD